MDSGGLSPNPSLLMSRGLPEITPAEKSSASSKASVIVLIILVLPLASGFGIAYAIDSAKPSGLAAKIELIRTYELQYIYIAIVLLGRTVSFQNLFPMIFKAKLMKANSGNVRANMYIYRVAGKTTLPTPVYARLCSRTYLHPRRRPYPPP